MKFMKGGNDFDKLRITKFYYYFRYLQKGYSLESILLDKTYSSNITFCGSSELLLKNSDVPQRLSRNGVVLKRLKCGV